MYIIRLFLKYFFSWQQEAIQWKTLTLFPSKISQRLLYTTFQNIRTFDQNSRSFDQSIHLIFWPKIFKFQPKYVNFQTRHFEFQPKYLCCEPLTIFLTEAFTVNFGMHSGDSVIWLASNDYTTYPQNALYRGAIVPGGENFGKFLKNHPDMIIPLLWVP